MKLTAPIFIIFLLFYSCANMVAPAGGIKDTTAPILVSISENKTTSMNEVHFIFNEYIQLNNWEENFYISPPFNKKSQKKIKGKTLIISIKDSLTNNTTYHLSLSNSIKDLNEGNITDSLSFIFGNTDHLDTLTLSGNLQNAYTLESIKNAWIMLFDESKNDTIIFKETPNYIAKTDKNGNFHFPNLKANNYKIVSLTDFDFVYNEGEQIAFSDQLINAEQDSFISLLSFNPIVVVDSIIPDTLSFLTNSSKTDSVLAERITYGNLKIITTENSPCIFQLLQNEKVITQFDFSKKPYSLTELVPGKYQLKFIKDTDKNGEWTTGSWRNKIPAERVLNYPTDITIRSNWDLEIEWIIEE